MQQQIANTLTTDTLKGKDNKLHEGETVSACLPSPSQFLAQCLACSRHSEYLLNEELKYGRSPSEAHIWGEEDTSTGIGYAGVNETGME